MQSSWNPERVEILRRMIGEGYSGSQIATELHITRSAVIGKAHRDHIPMSRRDNKGEILGPGHISRRQARLLKRRERRLQREQYVHRVKPKLKVFAASPGLELPPALPRTSDACDLLGLDSTRCHWPLWGRHDEPDKHYCGAKVAHASYCQHHYVKSFRPWRRGSPYDPSEQ